MKALTTLFVIGMFLMPAALADDADDVRQAVRNFFTAISAGDASAAMQYRAPGYYTFGGGGGLLSTASSVEEQRKAHQATVDAGVKRNYQLTHMEVKVYGDTAVVTGYLTGTRIQPNGTVIQQRARRTGVWVKQGGAWREVHLHQSPVIGVQ